jgi:hypothetical protein
MTSVREATLSKRTAAIVVAATMMSCVASSAHALEINFTTDDAFDSRFGTAGSIGLALAAQLWESNLTDPISLRFSVTARPVGSDTSVVTTQAQHYLESAVSVNAAYLGDVTSSSDAAYAATLAVLPGTPDPFVVNMPTAVAKALGLTPVYTSGGQVISVVPAGSSLDDVTSFFGPLIQQTVDDGGRFTIFSTDETTILADFYNPRPQIDGEMTWNTLSFLDLNDSADFDFFVLLAAHSLGHGMGFDGFMDGRFAFRPDEDLSPGEPGYFDPFFSIDGGLTSLALLDPDSPHWIDSEPSLHLMEPTLSRGDSLMLSNLDLTAFDVFGYDLASSSPSVPEPGSIWLFVWAFGLLGWTKRRTS